MAHTSEMGIVGLGFPAQDGIKCLVGVDSDCPRDDLREPPYNMERREPSEIPVGKVLVAFNELGAVQPGNRLNVLQRAAIIIYLKSLIAFRFGINRIKQALLQFLR